MADDIKCFPAALEYLERGRDILRPPNFKFGRFKAKRAGRSPSATHLNHRGGVSDIGHDRQPAKTGESTNVRAASMYQASEVEQFAPGNHGYPRASETR